MMEPESGTFKPLDETTYLKELRDLADISQEQKDAKVEALLRRIEEREGKPCIRVGEIVEVKGVRFQVQRIRAIGVVVLRMVPGQQWPKEPA